MDLVIAVGGGGQHIALAIARLLRIGAIAEPVTTFVIDADCESRLGVKLRSFGNTVNTLSSVHGSFFPLVRAAILRFSVTDSDEKISLPCGMSPIPRRAIL